MDSGQQGQGFERDYFETLITKYECRNAQFTQKQNDLRERLQAIECSLPALMSLNIAQTNTFQQPVTTEYDNSPVKEVTNESYKEHRKYHYDSHQLNADYGISRNIPTSPEVNAMNDMNLRKCTACNLRPTDTDLGRSNNFEKTTGQNIKSSGINTGNDIRYMARIKELAENERKLKNEIKELEIKEKTYKSTTKQPDDYLARDISYNGEGDAEIEAIKQKNQNLEVRNKALEDELEYIRKEIKQIKETVEEPMRRELESEKCRCINIEEQIHKRNTDVSSRESAQRKKLEFLQKQLQCANQNLSDLHVVNKRLKEELCMLNCRSNELQTDLINQKISEVHIISRVIASQNMEPVPPPPKPVLSITGSGDDDKGGRGGGNEELNKIARNLSKLIDEANSCDSCKNAHPDLIDTVRYIKNLVDIVNVKTDVEEIPKSDSDVFCKCVDWKKLREEMGLEEPPSLPEISASEPDISKPPEVSKPPVTTKPPEVTESYVKPPLVEEPSEVTDKRTSATLAADEITNVILNDITSITVIVDNQLDKIEEDTTTGKLEEGDTEVSTDLQTEQQETTVTETGDITDVSKTEPLTDMTEDESEAITTDVDETGEPARDKPTEEKVTLPEESEKPLEEGETPLEVPEVEAETPLPTEGEEKDETSPEEPPKLVEGEGEAESVKPTIEQEAAAEESVKPTDEEEIEAEESIKPIDEHETEAEESVKPLDEEEISAEESTKPIDEQEAGIEESVKPVEEIVAEESIKPVDEEQVAEESVEPIGEGEIATEESVKPIDGEEVAAEELIKPIDEEKIEVEDVKPTEGEETAHEVTKPAEEEEITPNEPVEPTEEEEIATEEPVKATEGEEITAEEPTKPVEIEDITPQEETVIKEIASEQDADKPVQEPVEALPEETPELPVEEEVTHEMEPTKEPDVVVEDIHEVPSKSSETEKVEDLKETEEIGEITTEEPEMHEPPEDVQEEDKVIIALEEEGDKQEEKIQEEKPSEAEKPISSDKELVEEIVRTICRCIRRDKPALCDCPVGDTKEPKKDSTLSKEEVVQQILVEVVSVIYGSDTNVKDTTGDIKSSPKPASKEPSKKSLEQIEQDKPPISTKTSKSLSKDASEKSLSKEDAASKKSQISPKGSTSKQPSEKSVGEKRDDIPAEAEKETTSPKVSRPASREPSTKSMEEKAETKVSPKTSKLHSKEPSRTSVEEEEKAEVSPKPSKVASKEQSRKSLEETQITETTAITKSPSKEPSKKSLDDKYVEKPISPKASKPTTKESSKISLEEKEGKTSPKDSKPYLKDVEQTSEKPSVQDLPHTDEELAPTMKTEEKAPKLFDDMTDTTPKSAERSKQTSREPSSKSLPPEIGASPKSGSKEKTRSDVVLRTAQITSDVPSKEPSAKLLSKEAITSEKLPSKEVSTKSLSKGGKSVSKELSIKSPSADIIPATPTEEMPEGKGMLIADVETEGNVPVEAEVELLSKSSDGVYVTTTVTSTGQVEVTTEGPTGVVETTLKVTESGNLEVVTGVTEFDKDAEGVVSKTDSDHPPPPEVEVLHAAVYDVEESQEGLDVQAATKSSDKITDEVVTEKGVKEDVEEVRPSTEAPLDVIAEEEEEAAEKDKKPIEQLPVDKKYCECLPVVVCKCKEDKEDQQGALKSEKEKSTSITSAHLCQCKSSKYEEIDEPKEQAIILCKCDETKLQTGDVSADELRNIKPEKDRSVEIMGSVEIKEEETPEGGEEEEEEGEKEEEDEEGSTEEEDNEDEDEPENVEGAVIIQNTVVVPSVKSVEIVENITAREACRTVDDEEGEDYESHSGTTVSDVSMFDDLPPDVMKTLKETSTTTVESAPAKSFVIETTIEYKSSERVLPPQREERASKSILKTGSSWNDSWKNINTQYANQPTAESRDATQERSVIKKRSVEAMTVSTSTTGLKFSTCTCDEKIQPTKRAKSESLENEETKPIPDNKQGTVIGTPGNTTVNNLKIIICNRDTCRTYTTDQESVESMPKLPTCECQKRTPSTQRQLSRICNTKTCGTVAGREQDRKVQTKESDKLLLENATCTTCDLTSCQVIKSGTNYSSMDSLLSEDEPIICPATCPSVGVQHPPKKLFDERSYEGMQARTAYFKGTTSRSFPGKVCPDTLSKSQGICVPSCPSKGVQRDASIKQKTHATNTPKSNKICALDVCRSSPSDQRTVSTYYSSSTLKNKSCDPIECEKRLSNVKFQDPLAAKYKKEKPKSPSEPKMSGHRPCDCRDATTDYKPPSSPNLKQNSIIKKPRRSSEAVGAPSSSQSCTCKDKTPSKRASNASKTSSIKTEDLMTTACTSLTCSKIQSLGGSKPESPSSEQTQVTTSCTCTPSKPESPISDQTQVTTSCTCSRSKPESPVSQVCTSETCSAIRKTSGSKPDSPTSGQTQITTSCSCPRSKPESPASDVCTSETCSEIRKSSRSKPDSPTSGQTKITTSCSCPRSKPESPVSRICTSETCSVIRKFPGSRPDTPTSGQTQITTSCTCPRSKPESPASKICTSETCSAIRKFRGSRPDTPTSGQTQITTSCTCPRSKPDSPTSGETKICNSATCSALQSEGKPESPTSDQPQITTSCTCPGTKPESPPIKICTSETCSDLQKSKPESPESDKLETCTSTTCSGLKFYTPATSVHSSIDGKTSSKVSEDSSQYTAPCRSDTCSAAEIPSKSSSSHKSDKQDNILSQEETPCRSPTCSNMKVSTPSAPASIASEKVPVESEQIPDQANTGQPIGSSEKTDVLPAVTSPSISKKSSASTQKSVTDKPSSLPGSKPDITIGDTAQEDQPGEATNTPTKLQTPTSSQLESAIKDEKTEKEEETEKNEKPAVTDDSKLHTPEKKDSSLPHNESKPVDNEITHPETEEQIEIIKEEKVINSSKPDTPNPSSKTSNVEDKREVNTTPSVSDKKSKTSPISSKKSSGNTINNRINTLPEIEVVPDDTGRENKKNDSANRIASETAKIPKSSVGDIVKSPKSASKYTLSENVTSVTDYNKKSVEKIVSQERDVVTHPTHELPIKSSKTSIEKAGEKKEENLKPATNETLDEDAVKEKVEEKVSKDKADSVKSKESERSGKKEISIASKESESSKIVHSPGGSSHSQQSSKRSSKEISKKSSEASKKSGTIPVETPQCTEGESETKPKVESTEKLPAISTKPDSGEKSTPTSKESLCLPCRRIQKASGDKISKPPKEPPDKGSKTSVRSTDSEKKSKIPLPITKIPSIDKEKHQGDCSCIQCLTEEMQKGKHPPDCDCVDCLCQPEKFEPTLPVVEEPEHIKEPESIPHSPSCTCIDCLCEPKGTIKEPSAPPPEVVEKPKHSPDCACVDCLCAPTGDIIKKVPVTKPDEQKGSTVIVFTCPSIPPAKVKTHHPDCKCPECVCDPCGHRPDCSCALCKCDPCKDVIVEFKKHPPDCTCPDCICAPCGDEKAEERKKHPPHCDCAECVCDPCNDTEVEERKQIMKPHPKDCNCPECVCKPCDDEKVEAAKLVSQHTQHVEDGSCTCAECVCDPCDDPKIALKKQPCKECGCLVCMCDPCEDPKIVEKRKPHPPTCNCPECICDPCNDPAAIRAHSPDCSCKRCICRPCRPREKPHGPTCDCPECVCAPCNDPYKNKPLEQEIIEPTELHKPNCKCKKCVCKPRKIRKKEPEKKPTQKPDDDTTEPPVSKSPPESPELIEAHGPKCKCSTCKLSKMLPTKEVSRIKTVAREGDLPGIPEECPECDCSPICVCENCPAKKNNTAPTAKSMKNEMLVKNIKDIEQENVRREKDINELQALMEQIRCACHDAERQAAKTAEPTYIQKASSFKNTLSGLQIAMNTLQEKCMVKDKMIEAMTQELRLRANSNIFHDMLKNITTATRVNVDFDRQEVCDSLPRPISDPKYGRSSYRYPQDIGRYECICEHGSVDMQILNIKQISPDSILIKWTQPENNKVIGYEVEVDNVLKSRIHSAQRTSAMVFAVNTKNKMNINVYAVTQFGRCQPPATCVYGS